MYEFQVGIGGRRLRNLIIFMLILTVNQYVIIVPDSTTVAGENFATTVWVQFAWQNSNLP
jgi:hypothetical protein